jgi:hypothetical protein
LPYRKSLSSHHSEEIHLPLLDPLFLTTFSAMRNAMMKSRAIVADNVSLDDDPQIAPSLPLAPDIPFFVKDELSNVVEWSFPQPQPGESPTMEALQMAVPPAPFQHMCHDDHGEGRSMLTPVPAFRQRRRHSDVEARWMHPRVLGP